MKEVEVETGNYDDDGINAGNEKFEKLTEQTLKNFELKTRVYNTFEFHQAHMKTLSRQVFQIDQRHFASNISPLP